MWKPSDVSHRPWIRSAAPQRPQALLLLSSLQALVAINGVHGIGVDSLPNVDALVMVPSDGWNRRRPPEARIVATIRRAAPTTRRSVPGVPGHTLLLGRHCPTALVHPSDLRPGSPRREGGFRGPNAEAPSPTPNRGTSIFPLRDFQRNSGAYHPARGILPRRWSCDRGLPCTGGKPATRIDDRRLTRCSTGA